jgi:flagellar protein FlaG
MQSINNIGSVPTQSAEFKPAFKTSSNSDIHPVVNEKTPSPPPTDSELKKAITQSNAALKQISSSLEFSQDKATGKTLIRVYDRDTKELIRQFPTEEMVVIAKQIENLKGVLVDQTV